MRTRKLGNSKKLNRKNTIFTSRFLHEEYSYDIFHEVFWENDDFHFYLTIKLPSYLKIYHNLNSNIIPVTLQKPQDRENSILEINSELIFKTQKIGYSNSYTSHFFEIKRTLPSGENVYYSKRDFGNNTLFIDIYNDDAKHTKVSLGEINFSTDGIVRTLDHKRGHTQIIIGNGD